MHAASIVTPIVTPAAVTITVAPVAGDPADRWGVTASGAVSTATHGLPTQSAAEYLADGLALGLRTAGHVVSIVIDAPSEDDADLLDFASFDAWAAERAEARAAGPEVDAVSARLARDAEAGHYRAAALGL